MKRFNSNKSSAALTREQREVLNKGARVMCDQRYFKVLVTRDVTESAVIPVIARGSGEAGETAASRELTRKFNHLFEPCDGSQSYAYLGDPEEDVTEISEEEYLALAVTLTDELRGRLVEACAGDAATTLGNDRQFRLQVAREGFAGFGNLSDSELVKAFCDAGLYTLHPDLMDAVVGVTKE